MRPQTWILASLAVVLLAPSASSQLPPPFVLEWAAVTDTSGHPVPHGLALDFNQNVYVASGNQILRYDPNGAYITAWGTPGSGDGEFNAPAGIAVDGNGNVYVADSQNQRIQLRIRIYDVGGRPVRTVRDEALAPAGAHSFSVGTSGPAAEGLHSGLSFYRVETGEGMFPGRIVVLRGTP